LNLLTELTPERRKRLRLTAIGFFSALDGEPTIPCDIINLLSQEYKKAVTEYPAKRSSPHEALAYILEEYRELEKEVFLKKRDKERMKTEAAHVAVTAIRFIRDMCGEE
jgi:hypothetical protein